MNTLCAGFNQSGSLITVCAEAVIGAGVCLWMRAADEILMERWWALLRADRSEEKGSPCQRLVEPCEHVRDCCLCLSAPGWRKAHRVLIICSDPSSPPPHAAVNSGSCLFISVGFRSHVGFYGVVCRSRKVVSCRLVRGEKNLFHSRRFPVQSSFRDTLSRKTWCFFSNLFIETSYWTFHQDISTF